MSLWSSIMFCDANSPIMEQLIFFHDHVIIVIIIILSMIMYMIMNIFLNKFYNYFLLENHELEVIWTLIPTILLIFIALPSLRLLYLMEESFTPNLTIKIIGHQWYWSYELTDFNIEFDSFMLPSENSNLNNFRLLDTDNNLIIPYNTFSRLLISAADVIHAWSVPSLGVKIDAVPGRLNQISFFSFRPGLFFGQCSEICGANHSFMPISLEITSLKNFFNWIKTF
uniref:Cytochrome c oxidase subunit 2 n=1 Tax=Hypoaspis linteyini TaxID=2695865 RepID=A0A6B9WHL5_9ACAR|nr:cytochrome c oxidase subunit II [Hypoaspis linteyini]QHQ98575.1 cytochrome oxidase subunit 2 [Hypoaspis linteyini]